MSIWHYLQTTEIWHGLVARVARPGAVDTGLHVREAEIAEIACATLQQSPTGESGGESR